MQNRALYELVVVKELNTIQPVWQKKKRKVPLIIGSKALMGVHAAHIKNIRFKYICKIIVHVNDIWTP